MVNYFLKSINIKYLNHSAIDELKLIRNKIMSIFKKSEEYQEFIKKHNIESENTTRNIKHSSIVELIIKIILVGIAIYWLYGIWAIFNSKEGSGVFIFLFFTSIPIGWIILMLLEYKAKRIAKLDQEIFDNFLTKRIKIFYTREESNNYLFNEIKHISKRLKDCKNPNQIIIELSFEAFILNAEGLIIVNRIKNSITQGETRKGGKGSIKTSIQEDAEAILINNIKEKTSRVENSKDLNYWFELKEKGAITEDEFNKKKEELL
jgi:hypothetical protein